jgi:hypothetical protein
MLFGSVWCRRIRSLHLILDNGSTHAPKRLPTWIGTLNLPFPAHLHWLPVNASWLDQIEDRVQRAATEGTARPRAQARWQRWGISTRYFGRAAVRMRVYEF